MASILDALETGKRHHLAGEFAEAERVYREILQTNPRHAPTLCLLGTLAMHQDRLELAVGLITDAIRADPRQGGYAANLGEAYRRLGKLPEAAHYCREAIKLVPDLPTPHWNLGLVYQRQGLVDQAAAEFRETVRLAPGDSKAHTSLGLLLYDQQKLPEAEVSLRHALTGAPDDPTAHVNLGSVLYLQDKLDEAIDCYERALELDPGNIQVRANLANMFKDQGQLDEAIAGLREAVRLAPGDDRAHSDLLYAMNFHPDYDAQTLWNEHRQWGQRHADPLTAASAPHDNDRTPDRRLRVGYVSAHFRAHAVSFFSEPILALHDHAAFEIFCYSDVRKPDDTTARLRRFADHWRDVAGQSDETVSQMIRRDKIDILVDLAGHIGGGRMLLFARKPAPVQVTYLGYQNTTGMQAMDYRLTDEWSDPPGTTERYYTEKLVRLPRTFFCYRVTHNAPPVAPLPAIANGYITFGSFNNFPKVTPQVMATWAKIMQGVENSRILILARVNPRLERRVHDLFRGHGIDPGRVELCPRRRYLDYLDLIGRCDIALDPFPFNGHTTTCDTLGQGVPVVALAGSTYASRFGSSALVNLGLKGLVASTPEQYVEIAVHLAGDRDRLVALRGTLRERMRGSVFVDARQFARDLENTYRQMWNDWCASTRTMGEGSSG